MAIGRLNIGLTGVQPGGLAKVIPTSVAVGSGSGSVDSNGNVTFSGASSISLNGCFSATYENYRFLLELTAVTSDANIFLKMRSGATDSSAGYVLGAANFTAGGVIGSSSQSSVSTGFYMTEVEGTTQGHYYSVSMDIKQPFLAQITSVNLLSTALSSVGSFYANFGAGGHWVNTSYDSLNIIASAGNITGKAFVYGYN